VSPATSLATNSSSSSMTSASLRLRSVPMVLSVSPAAEPDEQKLPKPCVGYTGCRRLAAPPVPRRVVLSPSELVGPLRVDQVGAPDVAVEQ